MGGGDGFDGSGDATDLLDGAGEVVAAGGFAVADMEDAREREEFEELLAEIGNIGGGADLIVGGLDGFACLELVEHALGEVVAARAEEPGGADDAEAVADLREELFALEFGSAVDVDGRYGIGFAVGSAALHIAAENVVGRDVDEVGAEVFGEFANIGCADGIQGIGVGGILFGVINASLCGAVDDVSDL